MSRGPPNIDGMVSLKVDNLSYRTSTETLRRKFERYGEIGDAYVPRDRNTGDSRGFGFVRFFDKRDAADAVKGMDGYELDGRDLRVDYARHERPNTMSRGGGRGGRRSRSRSRGRRSRSRSPRRRRSRTRSRSRSPRRRSRSPKRSRSRSARRSRSRSGSRGRSPADRKSRSRSRSRSKSRSRSRSRSN